MKNRICLFLILSTSFMLLSGCTTSNHEHVFGEWQYDEVYHWKPFSECTCGVYDPEIERESHKDKDGDNLCDTCPCPIKHEHITEDWQIDSEYHCKPIGCTWHSCDIDYPLLPHIDTDSNGLCDDCGYDLQTTDNVQ